MFDRENCRLKSVYLPIDLAASAEIKAKSEYMRFSAYIRKLIVEDLKRDKFLDKSV